MKYDTEVTALHGADSLEAVTVRRAQDGRDPSYFTFLRSS